MKYTELDLIDKISEWHNLIRKRLEDKWNETSDISISNSEWYIMSVIYKKTPTVSDVTKEVKISRQAIHKFIKKLETKGLVEIFQGRNQRTKSIQLTVLGEKCVEKYIEIKKELEQKIVGKLGFEQLEKLLEFELEI